MSEFHGFLFSKLANIGTKNEGPAYFLQRFDCSEISILKEAQPWEEDPILQKYLGNKITVTGWLEAEKLHYEKAVLYNPIPGVPCRYEFGVTYDAHGALISAQFPGMSTPCKPEPPKETELPRGQLVMEVYLGNSLKLADIPAGHTGSSRVRGRGCHHVGFVYHLISLTVTFNGIGEFVKAISTDQKDIAAKELAPLASANLTEWYTVISMGKLLIFLLPNNKWVRCVLDNSGIVISLPSDD